MFHGWNTHTHTHSLSSPACSTICCWSLPVYTLAASVPGRKFSCSQTTLHHFSCDMFRKAALVVGGCAALGGASVVIAPDATIGVAEKAYWAIRCASFHRCCSCVISRDPHPLTLLCSRSLHNSKHCTKKNCVH